MNQRTKQYGEMFGRVVTYAGTNTAALSLGARGTALVTTITASRDAIENYGSNQVSGRGEWRGGAASRRFLATELRAQLVEIRDVAETLDPEQYPGVELQFQLPLSRSYAALVATARAFVDAVTPIQQAYIDRDFPADFVEVLEDLIEDFDAATGRKNSGLQEQTGGTLGLAVGVQQGRKAVDELDAIITKKLRTTNPVLLGVWKLASRVYALPSGSDEEPGSGTSGTSASAQ
jgi:hypothetical protein